MARISGPHDDNYFMAARAVKNGSGWMGEARLFDSKPASFDDPSSVGKIAGDLGNASTELDAVENAEKAALTWIARQIRMRLQWELARPVYGWHQLYLVTQGRKQQIAFEKLRSTHEAFAKAGGSTVNGVDAIGVRGPALSLEDGRSIPHTAGDVLIPQLTAIMNSESR